MQEEDRRFVIPMFAKAADADSGPLPERGAERDATLGPLGQGEEPSLEEVIRRASGGNAAALESLRSTIRGWAKATLVYTDSVDSVVEGAVTGISRGLFGKPVPGRSLHWLDNVVRVLAEREAEDGGKERWEEWDPSWSDGDEKDGEED
jgi:hypothetical protein